MHLAFLMHMRYVFSPHHRGPLIPVDFKELISQQAQSWAAHKVVGASHLHPTKSMLSASVTRSLAGKYFSVLGLDRTHVEMLKKNQRNRAVGVNLLAKQGATCDEMDKQGGWTGTSHVRIHRIVCVCACTIVTAPDGG